MSTEQLQQLRQQTGAGVMDVKKALEEADGDYDKALEALRKNGAAAAAKKAGREAGEGVIMSYIHMDRIGVLVELNCETDFVARTDDFKALAKDLAMQVASMDPQYVKKEDIPAEVIEKEKEVYSAQLAEEGKPADVMEKILTGKIEKYAKEVCLMDQKFFKNEEQTIEQLIHEAVGKLGENIQVSRFVRFSLDDADKS
jgi:elongation factor Ts